MDGFCPVTISDKPIIDKFFNKSKRINSEKSFTTLFLWLDAKFSVIDDMLCIYSPGRSGAPVFHVPVGDGDKAAVTKKLLSMCPDATLLPVLKSDIPWITRMADGKVEFVPHRNYFDYVYKKDSLISLSGKKLHQKRNHFNKFMQMYKDRAELVAVTDENLAECRDALFKILDAQEGDTSAERAAMTKMFDNYKSLGIVGAMLKIDGQVAAQTHAERISKTTMLIHVEKADRAYEGAYAAINKLFLEHMVPKDVLYVNREEDMGIDGLVQAKMSYRPAFLLEKYRAVFK